MYMHSLLRHTPLSTFNFELLLLKHSMQSFLLCVRRVKSFSNGKYESLFFFFNDAL